MRAPSAAQARVPDKRGQMCGDGVCYDHGIKGPKYDDKAEGQSMRIPGEQRSAYPDEIGARAGVFVAAIRDDDMEQAWAMLSKETRGMRYGVWATRNKVDMQTAYQAAYQTSHPMRPALLADFRQIVLRYWPLKALDDIGVTPTRYIDDTHAFAFLPFGVMEDASWVTKRRVMDGVILPMLLEDGEWQVDMPGWRFAYGESQA